MDFICFDAETTDRGEILELSVHSMECNEIYHQYFKPEHTRRWRTDIHHITPTMVKNMPYARRCVQDIQKIVDDCTYVVGFAVDNDVRILESTGVKSLDTKHIVEVRQWYWYCVGRELGMDINGGPGLSAVAADLGVELSEDAAHSASADTLATVKCFLSLVDRFKKIEFISDDISLDLTQIVERFDAAYAVARENVMRQRAHGMLYILTTPRGMKFARSVDGKSNDVVAAIVVNDRYKAEYDLRKLFVKRLIKDSVRFYNLRQSDIEIFQNYSNEFDLDTSELCKRLLSRMERAPQLLRF